MSRAGAATERSLSLPFPVTLSASASADAYLQRQSNGRYVRAMLALERAGSLVCGRSEGASPARRRHRARGRVSPRIVGSISQQNPLGRLAAFLLTLSRENEQEGRDPVTLLQPLHCGVVADFLALSIDWLGSLLVQLEERGMIAPSPPQGLRLTGVEALRAHSQPAQGKLVRGEKRAHRNRHRTRTSGESVVEAIA